MKIVFMSFVFIFFSASSFAAAKPLEVDEKLTIRILDTSASKKTVLINRGHEDGIVVDTHAKFFLTTGVFARGVARKVSPARSIWSIYRIVKPEHIVGQKVANIKISLPIKLTEDPAQGIVYENRKYDIGEPVDVMDANKEGTEVQMEDLEERKDLGALMSENSSSDTLSIANYQKSPYQFELGALASFNFFSGTKTVGSTSTEIGSETDYGTSNLDFTLSGEKLFPSSNGFLRKIGLRGLFSYQSTSTDQDSVSTSTTNTILGLGLSYYFSDPFVVNKINYFLEGNLGTVTAEIDNGTNVDEGSGTFYSVGFGAKYLFGKRFGALAKLEYYSNTNSFDFDVNGDIRTDEYSLSGPRILFGFFARVF